jgi:hypothetical protein
LRIFYTGIIFFGTRGICDQIVHNIAIFERVDECIWNNDYGQIQNIQLKMFVNEKLLPHTTRARLQVNTLPNFSSTNSDTVIDSHKQLILGLNLGTNLQIDSAYSCYFEKKCNFYFKYTIVIFENIFIVNKIFILLLVN